MAMMDFGRRDAAGLTSDLGGLHTRHAAQSGQDPFHMTLVQGSLVATGRGDAAVEAIVPGDVVLTRGAGALPVVAVTVRTLTREALIAAHRLTPVLGRAGAFGVGLPRHDLRLHPWTKVCVDMPSGDAVTLCATDLIGEGQVMRVFPDGVTYIVLTLAAPGEVLVSGLWLASAEGNIGVSPGAQRQDTTRRGWCRIGDITPDWTPKGEAAAA